MRKQMLGRVSLTVTLALLLTLIFTITSVQIILADGDDVDPTVLPAWWTAESLQFDPTQPSDSNSPWPPFLGQNASAPARASVSSHILQAGHTYTSSAGLSIPNDACVTDTITVTVAPQMLVADVDVGLNIDMPLARGALTATLYSPAGTPVPLLYQNYTGLHANYDLRLDDESNGVIEDGNDDDTDAPYYDRAAAPSERLSIVDGENAGGAWTLVVCKPTTFAGGTLNLWSLWLELREPGPVYAMPGTFKGAPYKAEMGERISYMLVITNTGELAGLATTISDALPAGVTQSDPATYTVLGGGVVAAGFHATDPVTWSGSIPVGQGLVISIPVTITAPVGDVIVNTAIITDGDAYAATVVKASTQVYAPDTLIEYEGFDTSDGGFVVMDGEWQWGPPATGPSACHSLPGCWGTNDHSTANILSATLDLPTLLPTQTLWLQWWEWFDVAEDWSLLSAFLASSSNPVPTPIYGSGLATGLTSEQRAHERMWREVMYDVTPYASDTITLYFYYATALPFSSAGWYVDDVGLHVEAAPNFADAYKTAHTSKVAPGDTLTYTVYVTNSGRLTSTHGRMLDQLPAGLVVADASKVGGGNLTSGTDWVEWVTSAGAPLAPGEDVTITVVTTVSSSVACGQPLINTALITDSADRDQVSVAANPVFAYPAIYHVWDLELSDSGFITNAAGEWEWGVPAVITYPAGPPSAHSGQNVWGTNLDEHVDADASYLTKTVDLTGISPLTGLTLQWWEWLDAHDEWDHAFVRIASTVNPTPTIIYGQETGGLMPDQSARERVWTHVTVDITPWAGEVVTITFAFLRSAPFPTAIAAGWYLDDVSIHADCAHVSIAPDQSSRTCPGTWATYTLNVFNATDSADTLDISLDGGGWSASVDPASLSLGPGGTGVVTVGVYVPWTASLLAAHTTVVTATGQSSGFSDAAALETTVNASWIQASPVPTDVSHHALVEYGGEFYLVGGAVEGGSPITPTRKYSPTVDTWFNLAPEPTPETGSTPDACLGTNDSGDPVIVLFPLRFGHTRGLHIYNIASDSWYTAPYTLPLPSDGIGIPAIVSDRDRNVCYISGGFISDDITDTLYAYNVSTGTVASLPAMTTARTYHAAWLYDDMMCVGGGLGEQPTYAVLDSTQCYSITGGVWLTENVTLGPLPYPSWAMASTTRWVDGIQQLWMMGGVKNMTLPPTALEVESRTAHWDSDIQSWTLDAPLPHPVYLGAAAVQMSDVYVVGGETGSVFGATPSAFNQRLVPCPPPQQIYLPLVMRNS